MKAMAYINNVVINNSYFRNVNAKTTVNNNTISVISTKCACAKSTQFPKLVASIKDSRQSTADIFASEVL